ncbi:MAG: DnaD domain protein, partial [Acutalibacteraceae bacterium]
EVILMLIEYAKSKGKTGFAYISNLGRSWSEREIDSIEAVEAYIEEQNSTDEMWREFRSLTGVKNANPTTKQRNYFSVWKNELGFDCEMIYLAYEISIEKTEKMSLAYMDKVLKNWHKNGIKTPVDVQKEQEQWASQTQKSKKSKPAEKPAQSDSSYDLDAFAKKSLKLKYQNN